MGKAISGILLLDKTHVIIQAKNIDLIPLFLFQKGLHCIQT